ncbi:hypothetical protein [Sporosarcina phage Lietuvens]|nr:hypothetical protein [Sporosarcina phage Lietuvens]
MTNLAPAKEYWLRNIDDWNTTSFHSYLQDKHEELFHCDYAPFRGWRAEQGMIGSLIGTAGKNAKPRKISNADLLRFIDETFAEYTPTMQYPGTSLGFMLTYRKNVLQRIQTESLAQARRKEGVENTPDLTEITEWW